MLAAVATLVRSNQLHGIAVIPFNEHFAAEKPFIRYCFSDGPESSMYNSRIKFYGRPRPEFLEEVREYISKNKKLQIVTGRLTRVIMSLEESLGFAFVDENLESWHYDLTTLTNFLKKTKKFHGYPHTYIPAGEWSKIIDQIKYTMGVVHGWPELEAYRYLKFYEWLTFNAYSNHEIPTFDC